MGDQVAVGQDSVRRPLARWIGLVTFLFFLIKGLLWASAPVLVYLFG